MKILMQFSYKILSACHESSESKSFELQPYILNTSFISNLISKLFIPQYYCCHNTFGVFVFQKKT